MAPVDGLLPEVSGASDVGPAGGGEGRGRKREIYKRTYMRMVARQGGGGCVMGCMCVCVCV